MLITPQTRICLSSADGHVGAPTKDYRKYLEKALHPDFDDYLANHMWRWAPQSKDSFFPREISAKMWNTEGFDPALGSPVAWDPKLRIKAQDDARLACEILFPDDQNTNDPPWGSGLASGAVGGRHGGYDIPPMYVRAGARAYNRWLAEFCSADPLRLHGIILLGTMEDTIWCVEEIIRAYNEGLRAGVMLPLDYDQPYYHHERYDKVWATCQELGLPVITHVSRGHPKWLGDDPWVQRFLYVHESNFYAQRPIWCMIMGGTFERFPDLRLVITELDTPWVAPLIQKLDGYLGWWPEMQASRDVPGRVTRLTMKPSEYWARNVYCAHTTAQRREQFEGQAYDDIPNMIFGIDIGHNEGWWPVNGWPEPVAKGSYPAAPEEIFDGYKRIWSGLPADRIMPYLEYNCFRAYPNISRDRLQPIVDKVGPTVAELGLTV